MENMELPPPTCAVLTSKESKDNFCFFCCKSFSDSQSEHILQNRKFVRYKTEIEQRFLKFIGRQFQYVTKSTKQSENSKEQESPLTCPDCFTVVDSYCKLYHQIKCLELRLNWEVEKIRKIMKFADRLPVRVKAFREWCNAGVELPGGITIKTEPGVTSVAQETFFTKRQRFKRKCRRYRSKRMPRVLITSIDSNGNGKITDMKLDRENQKKDFSHFNDMLSETSSTITSIASGFCGDVVTIKNEKKECSDAEKEYFLGWVISFVTVVFLYHLDLQMMEIKVKTASDEDNSIPTILQEEEHSITIDEGVYPIVVKQEIAYNDDENYSNEVKENDIYFPVEDPSNKVKAEEIIEEISNDDSVIKGNSGKIFIVEEFPEKCASTEQRAAASLSIPEETDNFPVIIKSTTTLAKECAKSDSVIPFKSSLSSAKKRSNSQNDFSNLIENIIIKSLSETQSNEGANNSKKHSKSSAVQFLPIAWPEGGGSVKRRRLHNDNCDSELQITIESLLKSPPQPEKATEEKPELISNRSLRKIFKCEKCLGTFSSSERLQTHVTTCSMSKSDEEIPNEDEEDAKEDDDEDLWDEHETESVPSPEQLSETDEEDNDDRMTCSYPPSKKKTDVQLFLATQSQSNIKMDFYKSVDSGNSCLHCSKEFNGKFHLVCHMWRMHRQCTNVNNYPFRDIVISTGTDLMLTVDDIVYDRKGRFFCSKCNKGFTEGVDLVHHSKLHGDFKCKFCKESRNFASALALHELMHVKSKRELVYQTKCSFSCVRCSFTSEMIEGYVAHYVETHLGLVMDAKRCPICKYSYKFKELSDLRIAIVMHYADCHDLISDECNQEVVPTKQIHWCVNEGCKAFFRKNTQLQEHVQKIHTNIISKVKGRRKRKRQLECSTTCFSPSVSCSDGGEVSASQNDAPKLAEINAPSSLSEKDFKFKCNFKNCGTLYNRQIDLDVHVLQVHLKRMEEMPECPKKCGQRFSSEHLKNVHLRTHHGQDYSCNLCGQKFAWKDKLSQHKLDDHPEVGNNWKLSCSVCKKKLISKRTLEKHMLSHSPEEILATNKKSNSESKQLPVSRPSSSSGVSSIDSASLKSQNDGNDEMVLECPVDPLLLDPVEDEPMVDLQSTNDESIVRDPLSLEEDNNDPVKSNQQSSAEVATITPLTTGNSAGIISLVKEPSAEPSTLPSQEYRYSFNACMNRVQDVVNKLSLESIDP